MWLFLLGVALTLAIELAGLVFWAFYQEGRRSQQEAEHFVDLVCRQDHDWPVSHVQREGLN
jgi:hypothetical protein